MTEFNTNKLYDYIKDYCFDECVFMKNSSKYHECDNKDCQLWAFLQYVNKREGGSK